MKGRNNQENNSVKTVVFSHYKIIAIIFKSIVILIINIARIATFTPKITVIESTQIDQWSQKNENKGPSVD